MVLFILVESTEYKSNLALRAKGETIGDVV
jgi:hypothetical protein